MKSAVLALLGLASPCISPFADGRTVPDRRESTASTAVAALPRVVSANTVRRHVTNPLQRDRQRRMRMRRRTSEDGGGEPPSLDRRGALTAALDNEETLYFINATLGTPPQPVRLHLDTGSSDLWVNTPGSTLCLLRSQPCAFAGTYSANSSSTYQYIGSYFNISYVDGSGADGDYVSDTFSLVGGAETAADLVARQVPPSSPTFSSSSSSSSSSSASRTTASSSTTSTLSAGPISGTNATRSTGAASPTATVSPSNGGTLERLQFGVGYRSTSAQGILGIGYAVNEVQVSRANRPAYANLPAQLVAEKRISSKSYSLWLNDVDANTGSILFGGIDTAQYMGTLQTLPVQKQAGMYSEFLITLTGLQMATSRNTTSIASGSASGADDTLALAVLLDSGSSLSYLPDDMVQTVYNQVGAMYDANEGAAYVPCSLAQQNTSLLFEFGGASGPTIAVSMSEFVLPLITAGGQQALLPGSSSSSGGGQAACLFGLAPSGASSASSSPGDGTGVTATNVLGDTFLRSAYVVYDLDNNQISLAQTAFNASPSASHVLEIAAGPSGVPGAVLVANAVAATQGLHTSAAVVVAGRHGLTGGAGMGLIAALAGLLLML